MPLPLWQLERATDEELKRDVVAVHSYLAANRHLAFTGAEVAEALGLAPDDVVAILEKLDDLDLVRRGVVNDEVYFLYDKELPLL